ncbi:deoxyribose-phosphate aldolase [Kineosporia succinea]|uniref:Deoxyribose-phosphate aldolase n=1 Tax=Kineosporia succinea TaxID=84632 RepID=A0ABT9PDA8_9ACTN|nr:deoxyribose-phosphate aldolase [Kineosporia succinea]MDP9830476.1 deoxyribose-phosphate aldolase [Kineosporia succinea]
MSITRESVAGLIDHTLLKPEATPDQVAALCREAAELNVFSVCVSPSQLPLPAGGLPSTIAVATVCGFPSGSHAASVKAAEAAQAVRDGATEVDMVINLGLAKSGDWDALTAEIAAVKKAVGSVLLKVIIESAALTDDEIVAACQASEAAGADYVKTSTGFHPAGGATAAAVRLMAATVGGRLGVKASGGIRTAAAATEMIEAGATRLGLSGSRAILEALSSGTEVTGPGGSY